jgi:hypothetical protein
MFSSGRILMPVRKSFPIAIGVLLLLDQSARFGCQQRSAKKTWAQPLSGIGRAELERDSAGAAPDNGADLEQLEADVYPCTSTRAAPFKPIRRIIGGGAPGTSLRAPRR